MNPIDRNSGLDTHCLAGCAIHKTGKVMLLIFFAILRRKARKDLEA